MNSTKGRQTTLVLRGVISMTAARSLFLLVVVTALLGCTSMPITTGEKTDPTITVDLQYQPGKSKVVASFTRGQGQYLGSGVGRVHGRLNGRVEWDLYEDQRAENLHRAQFIGVITTDDGTRIHFESVGFFVPRKGDANFWDMTAALVFHTDSAVYTWLNAALATWNGVFDMSDYRHSYKVYLY